MTPIEYFNPKLSEPSDYHQALPTYINAYVCASISELCYKSSVNAKHTDQVYKDRVISTLKGWGWDDEDAEKTIVINSREIVYGKEKKIPGTQGLIIFHQNVVFIGFRGSENKFNDWFKNFTISKKSSQDYKGKIHNFPGKIHRGFLEAFHAIVPENGVTNADFEKIIAEIRGKQIWLTGHSLGGALASVAASYLLSRDIKIEGIYTFGTPRVGDPKYRDYLNKELTYKYWRFMNGNDLVSDIPLPLSFLKIVFNILPLGFSREGFMLRLTEGKPELLRTVDPNGTRQIWQRYNGTNARDHSMGNYRSRLLKLAVDANNIKTEDLQMPLENELYLTDEEINEIEKKNQR
jgi:pimeloyl-ACP methyl ester carboxylesterase